MEIHNLKMEIHNLKMEKVQNPRKNFDLFAEKQQNFQNIFIKNHPPAPCQEGTRHKLQTKTGLGAENTQKLLPSLFHQQQSKWLTFLYTML